MPPKAPPSQNLRLVLAHVPNSFNAVSFSPDGKWLASGSDDKTVRVWDATSGQILRTLQGHKSGVWCVSFSGDGRQLASSSDDGTVRVWDTTTGNHLRTLAGHADKVPSVAFSEDGKRLASGCFDKTVQLWDAESGKLLRTLQGHTAEVLYVAFSGDGKRLASGSRDRTVRVWDAASGQLLRTLEGHAREVLSLSFSPDGTQVASSAEDKTVRVWDAASGQLLRTLQGHAGGVTSVVWSGDGKRLATGSDDESVRVWDAASGQLLRTLQGHTDWVWSVAFSRDGKQLASGSYDKTMRVWDAESGQLLRTIKGHARGVWSVAWSADGQRLASASDEGTVVLWEAATGKPLQTLEGHAGEVREMAFSRDGKRLASASNDNTVRIWDVASGQLQKTLEGHTREVLSLSFSEDGKRLASSSNDTTVRIWEAESGELLWTLQGHADGVWSVAFSGDGKWLASASNDKTVRVWDAASGKLLRTLEGHSRGLMRVVWSEDGRQLASCADDKTVRVWDAASGKPLAILEGHLNAVWSLSFSADGKWLASSSDDETIRLWDAESWECLDVISWSHPSYRFASVAFAPPGVVADSFRLTNLDEPSILVTLVVPKPEAQGGTSSVTRICCAKIVLMGESGVGKSGLALRLAEDRWEAQVSTHGMRVWSLPYEKLDPTGVTPPGERRDVVLWDLGGQDEYRLVHQLFLHDTTLALLLLDPSRDTHFADVEEWNLRLAKQRRGQDTRKLLVGAKADQVNRELVDTQRISDLLAKWQLRGYTLTSAKDDLGIAELRTQIAELIDWEGLSKTTRPRLWQHIRDRIDALRQKGRIVMLYSELEADLRASLPSLREEWDGEAIGTVVEQLASQGVITDTRLSTGERALLLQIGYVEIYAASLIRLAREAVPERGVPALELSEAIFRRSFPGISEKERLKEVLAERSVLECVMELLIEHGICLKHERLLIFPSLFPEAVVEEGGTAQRTVSLYYDFSGAIDNIYASLVAQLAISQRFGRVRLRKDRVEFEQTGHGACALRRYDRSGGWSHMDLLFSKKTSAATRELFTTAVEAHLQKEGVTLREVLQMECAGCAYRFEEELVRDRISQSKIDVLCPRCEVRSPINPGAKKHDPQVAGELIGLRRSSEKRRRHDIEEAKRELGETRIFISYAKADDELCHELFLHILKLGVPGSIGAVRMGEIATGLLEPNAVMVDLERANIVLLLVSADYIASDYCVKEQMQRVLARHAAGQSRVIPILVHAVDGWQTMPFGRLAPLPQPDKPISDWQNQDKALAAVAVGVRRAVEEFMRPSPQSALPGILHTDSPALPVIEPTPIRILHLSDLHFSKDDDPVVRLQPLLRDVQDRDGGLGLGALDYLVISGDLTQRGTPEEFERAHQFISGLIEALKLSAARVVVTPGNHDLCWEPEVYAWHPKRKVDLNKQEPGSFVPQGDGYLLRDDANYHRRWENFGRFYHQLTQHPYGQPAEAQYRTLLFDELRVQFLEINSAWQIDEFFKNRSGLQKSALAAALTRANAQLTDARKQGRLTADATVFRIAVWHHPVTGNEKIKDDAFVDQLRSEGFRLCLHGHVHEDRADVVRYLHARKLHVAGAGSFGAGMRERPESTPRLYNLLELARDHSKIRVHTRCLQKDGGAWEGWAVWPDEDATRRRTYYEVRF